MTPYLHATDLACERDGRLLFEHLQVQVGAGDMLQVCGPNGCGKTSLLRLLAGLMQPAEGQVAVMPAEQPAHRRERGRQLLWIGHATGIKDALSAEENLAWLCALHTPASREHIWTALAAIGLRGFEDVPCQRLSAGQQRRVALARLYLPGPPLWILDEPFTALDAQAVEQLERHLVDHCERGGIVVLTTHHVLGQTPNRYRRLELDANAA
ncbi:cytochrome c biogenesis heme-transporting ATPase CcmA [Pseudomonas rhizosphaerae]|uniref:cytochrome c biogenesis heme-transporting ATPase CcmA n=1 Tax=Pseudomonas rhizosphaerae TaxID=216142 RepID=UPI002B48B4BE|nr:cytochrome c biogenesis heme-transporting ATPase CcmA [Pseudomonas rhizosphaerae]MEB2871062.1 cytochrome c biogenesis heme-transporting ATPase CcmA [Pseudomonas rhizosphaerae]